MACGPYLLAKRAFVGLLLALARTYQLTLAVNRDSDEADIHRAYRKVLLKVHPDKRGSKADAQRLQAGREKWDTARANKTGPGPTPGAKRTTAGNRGPATPQSDDEAPLAAPHKQGFRVCAHAVLLTYQGVQNQSQWSAFVKFVQANLLSWGVEHWCATLEQSREGKLHFHLQLQFRHRVDRESRSFAFQGLAPNASCNDFLGGGVRNGRGWQKSVDRAFFYVWADKIGTARDSKGQPVVAGNYGPAWTQYRSTYQVLGKWPETLWKEYKLSNATYEAYLFACRDGVLSRKRNLDAVVERERDTAERAEMGQVVKRVRRKFEQRPTPPEVAAWLQVFQQELDRPFLLMGVLKCPTAKGRAGWAGQGQGERDPALAARLSIPHGLPWYPFLVLRGPSRAGKTEFAKSLFKNALEVKVGALLEHFPERMRQFSRQVHDALVLDDVRDFYFLVKHQEKLQAKYEPAVEFGSTPGGQCAFFRWMWRIPVVVTANRTTKNWQLLDSDDFLGNQANRVVVDFAAPQPATGGVA